MLVIGVLLVCIVLAAFALLRSKPGSKPVKAVMETARHDYKVTEGVDESVIFVTDKYERNLKLHILRVAHDSNTTFKATSAYYYSQGSTRESRKMSLDNWTRDDWGYTKVTKQASDYENSQGTVGKVIAATNADFFYYDDKNNGRPYGELIIEGNRVNKSDNEPFFAVMKDGSYRICEKDENKDDVLEAVSGEMMLKDGEIISSQRIKEREPRQAIGITEDKDVVIVNVEGRSPESPGIEVDELAEIMKMQGCVNALNLDGGGSASFLTQREGDEGLVFRNAPADGFIRNVSSSLLIVREDAGDGSSGADESADNDDEKDAGSDSKIMSMVQKGTGLKKDEEGRYEYQINGKKQNGIFEINGKVYCFDEDGAGYSGKLKLGMYKYAFEKGALTGSTDENAGEIEMGLCGAEGNGNNLLYIYHKGDNHLSVVLNPFGEESGKMKNWNVETRVPWYSYRAEIKSIYVGDGVENIGGYFGFVQKSGYFEGSPEKKSQIESVRLPKSVEYIGKRAFFNTSNLNELNVPGNIKKIDDLAFEFSGPGTIRFDGDTPPELGKRVYRNSAYDTMLVKNNDEWGDFVKSDSFKKSGFGGKVIFQ